MSTQPFKRSTEEVLIAYSKAQKEYTERRKECGSAVRHCQFEYESACTFPNCLRDHDGGKECEASPGIHALADAAWKAKAVRGRARAAVLNRAHALSKREQSREVRP